MGNGTNNRRAGIIYVKVDGKQYDAKGAYTYNLGKPKRDAIIGADGVHGYKETPQVAFIEGAVTDSDELDLATLVTADNVPSRWSSTTARWSPSPMPGLPPKAAAARMRARSPCVSNRGARPWKATRERHMEPIVIKLTVPLTHGAETITELRITRRPTAQPLRLPSRGNARYSS